LEYDLFSLPKQFHPAIFGIGHSLQTQQTEAELKRHDVLVVNGKTSVLDVRIRQPVLVVKLASAAFFPIQWAFNRATLLSEQAIAASDVDSELGTLSRALGAMGSRVGLPSLRSLVEHPQHFVRWTAL
jgi:hypothetical protein